MHTQYTDPCTPCDVMAADRTSTSSSPLPSPPPSPSRSASGDEPDGQSAKRGKRKHEETDETDMPEDTKRRRVSATSDDETVEGDCYRNIDRLVEDGQYREALTYIRTKTVSSVSSNTELQRYLQKTMISLITDRSLSCDVLGLEYADVMMDLLSDRLEDYSVDDDIIYCDFFGVFIQPDYSESLFKLAKKYTTNLKDKRRMWRIMFRIFEKVIVSYLEIISHFMQADMPESLQKGHEWFIRLVKWLPAILHDESDPALSLSWFHDSSATETVVGYVPMFTKAVELRLVQEAKLLYDAGAVNSAELTDLAKKPDVEKMLSSEEDRSDMAVFLRKVLKQPRRLESIALLRVSRLVGQEIEGWRSRVKQLPLPSKVRDTLLLRPQVNSYRKETECNDLSTHGGV